MTGVDHRVPLGAARHAAADRHPLVRRIGAVVAFLPSGSPSSAAPSPASRTRSRRASSPSSRSTASASATGSGSSRRATTRCATRSRTASNRARRTASTVATAEEIWALRRRLVRGRAGRGARHHRPRTAPASRRCSRSSPASRRRRRASAVIRGRVGSLLEVGTGFHPELTGRENIYLNGAILGMTRREITRKFDEIVEFSGVEQVHRHAGQALLERHVRAARVLGRRAPRAGDPARRRGAGRRRRGVPAPVPRPDGGARRATAARCSSSRTTCRRSRGSATGRSCSARGGVVKDGPSERGRRPLPADGGRRWARTASGPISRRHPGGKRVRLREVRVVDEHGGLVDSVDIRRPVGIEIAFTRPARRRGRLPEDQADRPRGQQRLQLGRCEPTLERARRQSATTSRRPGSQATCSTRACTRSRPGISQPRR